MQLNTIIHKIQELELIIASIYQNQINMTVFVSLQHKLRSKQMLECFLEGYA